MTFTLFDIVILAIISISSMLGIYRGMVAITINLLGFISSIVAAILLYPYILVLFSGYIESDLVTSIVSGVVSYIASLIFFTFLTSKIVLLFEDSSKGTFDRFLGLIIGIIRGVLFALILFAIIAILTAKTYKEAKEAEDLVFNLKNENYPDWVKNSTMTPYLEDLLKNVTVMVPQELLRSIKIPEARKRKDEDLIDSIKRRKGDVQPLIEIPLDGDLESDIKELFPEKE